MKYVWMVLGWLCVVLTYVGFITPGIPFSHFLLGAVYCFSKSSPRMEKWLYNHPWFGEFLTNWKEKKIFPIKAKIGMVVMMSSSLIIMYFTVPDIMLVVYAGVIMALVATFVWWKFPSS